MENPQNNKFEDRLSTLPGGVIQFVMDFLPVRDAARTCVLSSKWRYVWADHPSLVLDQDFWKHIQQHILCKKKCENLHYANIVSRILLHHVGHIQKFFLDVGYYIQKSVTDVSVVIVSSNNVDSWISSLCRRGLKVLQLKNSGSEHRYKVPIGVLLTSELTNLSLDFCYIKETVGCFNNIQSLNLAYVQLDSVVLTTPLLTSLTLMMCICTSGFDIYAPKLASLTLRYNRFVSLKPFFTCTDINYAVLLPYESSLQTDGKHMLELLALWPKMSVLVVDGITFKNLATGIAPADTDDIIPLNLRRFMLVDVDLDSERISWILYLLKNSPLLHTFVIWFGKDLLKDIIDEPMDFKMDQLRTVTVKDFTASRNQLMFVKMLLKNAPLLEKLLVEEDEDLDLNERMKILRELLTLQRINPKTEIVFAPKPFSSKLWSGDA